MATSLKRIDLYLEEELIDRLQREAEHRRSTPSEVVQSLLTRDLGWSSGAEGVTERLRFLRERIGPLSDSTAMIRKSRDEGW